MAQHQISAVPREVVTTRYAVRFADAEFIPREAAHGGERVIREHLTFWGQEPIIGDVLSLGRPLLHSAGLLAYSVVAVHLWLGAGQINLTVEADHNRYAPSSRTLFAAARLDERATRGGCGGVETPGRTGVFCEFYAAG